MGGGGGFLGEYVFERWHVCASFRGVYIGTWDFQG